MAASSNAPALCGADESLHHDICHPSRDVRGIQCLSTSPEAPVNRNEGGEVKEDRWVETSGQLHGQTWLWMQSDTLQPVFTLWRCRIREPDIFNLLEISRWDEISKWSTCLKMHGIPQGWARATGNKSNTPAPGVKTERESDTYDLKWLTHKLHM